MPVTPLSGDVARFMQHVGCALPDKFEVYTRICNKETCGFLREVTWPWTMVLEQGIHADLILAIKPLARCGE